MNEDNLKIVAEQDKFNKQLFLGLTDLLSLEPIDENFRPLRNNSQLWQEDENNLTPYFRYIRPQIRALLKEIDFKKLAHEVDLLNYTQSVEILDDIVISDEEWK